MSMEVNSNYKDYKNDYLERLQEEREKAKEVGNGQDTEKKREYSDSKRRIYQQRAVR